MFTLLNVLSIYLTILNVKMRVFKIYTRELDKEKPYLCPEVHIL